MKTIPLPFIIPALLATIVMFSSAAPGMEDLCLKKIPPDLRKQLIQSFPNDRFPTMGDIKKENIEEDLKHGGDGCLLVTVGDFDGDKKEDIAMILFAKMGGQLRLVAALKGKETWKIESLSVWDGRNDNPYIQTLSPGKYVRTEALEGPINKPGELASFSSKLTGFVHGTIESSGCAYFFSKGKWVHVWISD